MTKMVVASKCRFDEVFVVCNTLGQEVYDLISFKYNRMFGTALDPKSNNNNASANSSSNSGSAGNNGDEQLETIHHRINELANIDLNKGGRKFRVLLILDDLPAVRNKMFESLVRNARHNNISIIFITHNIRNVDVGVRLEFDIFMLSEGKYSTQVIDLMAKKAAAVCKQLHAIADSIPIPYRAFLVTLYRDTTCMAYCINPNERTLVDEVRAKKQRLLDRIYTKESYYFHMRHFDESLIHAKMPDEESVGVIVNGDTSKKRGGFHHQLPRRFANRRKKAKSVVGAYGTLSNF